MRRLVMENSMDRVVESQYYNNGSLIDYMHGKFINIYLVRPRSLPLSLFPFVR